MLLILAISLIALAALSASAAFAQSAFTIDGIFDAGYQSIDFKGTKISGVQHNGSSTSQLNFRVNQDLGGGLFAIARLESDFNAVAFRANTGVASATLASTPANSINSVASTWGNGEVWAGLNSPMGTIKLGSINFNTLTTTGTMQPFGTAVGSGYTTGGGILRTNADAGTVRDENMIHYTSPSFSGLNLVLNWSAKQTKPNNGASASPTTGLVTQQSAFNGFHFDKMGSKEIGANYSNGPLAVSFSQLTQDMVDVSQIGAGGVQVAGTTATKVTSLGGAYTMGALKFMLGNQKVKTSTGTVATDTSYTPIAATYAMGATTLQFATGTIKQNAGANAGKDSKLTSIGLKYDLSKTTSAYVRNESIKDDTKILAANPTVDGTGNTRKRTAIGISVGF